MITVSTVHVVSCVNMFFGYQSTKAVKSCGNTVVQSSCLTEYKLKGTHQHLHQQEQMKTALTEKVKPLEEENNRLQAITMQRKHSSSTLMICLIVHCGYSCLLLSAYLAAGLPIHKQTCLVKKSIHTGFVTGFIFKLQFQTINNLT